MDQGFFSPSTTHTVPSLAICALLDIPPEQHDLAATFGKPLHWQNAQLIDHWLQVTFKANSPAHQLSSVLPATVELFKREIIARLH